MQLQWLSGPAAGKTNSMQTFSFWELIGERSLLFNTYKTTKGQWSHTRLIGLHRGWKWNQFQRKPEKILLQKAGHQESDQGRAYCSSNPPGKKLSFDQINAFGILQYIASYWNIVCIDTRISLIGLLNHFLVSFWLKQKLGMHLPNVKAKNLPEENWTLCHKGVEAPEDWWYLKL